MKNEEKAKELIMNTHSGKFVDAIAQALDQNTRETVEGIEKELRRLEEIAENESVTIDGKECRPEHCTCLGHAIWLLFEATEEEREKYWKS